MGSPGAVGAPGSRGAPGDIGPEVRHEIMSTVHFMYVMRLDLLAETSLWKFAELCWTREVWAFFTCDQLNSCLFILRNQLNSLKNN